MHTIVIYSKYTLHKLPAINYKCRATATLLDPDLGTIADDGSTLIAFRSLQKGLKLINIDDSDWMQCEAR